MKHYNRLTVVSLYISCLNILSYDESFWCQIFSVVADSQVLKVENLGKACIKLRMSGFRFYPFALIQLSAVVP